MQSVAKRTHSNSCFRQLTGSDTAHLLETRVLNPCTASRVLSVVYTTDKNGENFPAHSIKCLVHSWILFRFCTDPMSYGRRSGIVQDGERVTHLPPAVAAPSGQPRNTPDDCAFAIADVRLRPRRQPQSVRQAHWNALAIRTRPGFIPQENGRTQSAAEDGRR
jgi:hypothetical protein